MQCAKSLGFLIQTAYQRTVPVPSQKRRTVPTYRTRTITKKAYRTSVPYFLAKIEAYRTVPTYRTVLPSLLVISERAVNAANVEKYLSEKERSILGQKLAKSIGVSNESARDETGIIAINDMRTNKQGVNCDDYQVLK